MLSVSLKEHSDWFMAATSGAVVPSQRWWTTTTMDTLGFEPGAFRMRTGCDTTTPCALDEPPKKLLARNEITCVQGTQYIGEWFRSTDLCGVSLTRKPQLHPATGHIQKKSPARVTPRICLKNLTCGAWHHRSSNVRLGSGRAHAVPQARTTPTSPKRHLT